MPGSRKAEKRLKARREGMQNYDGRNTPVVFGTQGKLYLHKPGSQNRKK